VCNTGHRSDGRNGASTSQDDGDVEKDGNAQSREATIANGYLRVRGSLWNEMERIDNLRLKAEQHQPKDVAQTVTPSDAKRQRDETEKDRDMSTMIETFRELSRLSRLSARFLLRRLVVGAAGWVGSSAGLCALEG
jgi:hypothetical protein